MSLWESTSRATWDLFLTKYPEALAYACSRKVINYFICFLSFYNYDVFRKLLLGEKVLIN